MNDMVELPPQADERPEELTLTRMHPSKYYTPEEAPEHAADRVPRLPVGPGVTKCVHARLLSAHGVLAIKPGSGEIRIPYFRRKDKGDFKRFMNTLVDEFDVDRFRFTNVFMSDDEADAAYDAVDEYFERLGIDPIKREGDVRLDEALNGFDHEVEDWGDEDADTLVGRWER